MIVRAVQLLQERARKHPVEAVAQTSDYTASDEDLLIAVNATSAAVTVDLPTAAARKGRRYIVKKTDASANLVTIDPAGSETIDGEATVSLAQQYAAREIVSDGTNWHIVSAYGYSA